MPDWVDATILEVDRALRSLINPLAGPRTFPETAPGALSRHARRRAAALMRVNHVGEVCAQALYRGQAIATKSPELKAYLEQAAKEETDHLAWTARRLKELEARPSLLNPFWYGASLAMGVLAGRGGDARSLGFVVETERQVERHLASHLERLPEADCTSRAIVEEMRQDEIRHGMKAKEQGAVPLPLAVCWAMRVAAKCMTHTAYWL